MVETRRGSSSSKRPLSSSPPSNTKRSKVIRVLSHSPNSIHPFFLFQFFINSSWLSILSDYDYRFLKMLHQPLCLQFRSKNLQRETNLVNLMIFNNHLIYQKLLLWTFLMVVILINLILTQSNLTLCLLSLQVFKKKIFFFFFLM